MRKSTPGCLWEEILPLAGNRPFRVLHQLKQGGRMLRVFTQQNVGAEGRQCFQIHSGGVFGTVPIQQVLGLGLFHDHVSACLGHTELTVQGEHLLGVFRPGGVEHAEHLVDPVGKVGGHMAGDPFAIDFFQDSKYNMKGMDQNSKLIFRGRIVFGFLGCLRPNKGLARRRGGTVSMGRAAQQVVAGDLVVVGSPHKEVQTALSNAFFIVREQRLGNTQIRSRFLLTKSTLFPQKRQDPWKIGIRHKKHLDCRRGRWNSLGKDVLWGEQRTKTSLMVNIWDNYTIDREIVNALRETKGKKM